MNIKEKRIYAKIDKLIKIQEDNARQQRTIMNRMKKLKKVMR